MQRRQFLNLSGALPLSFALGHAQAATPQAASPRFLLVFLRGAYDCSSLLVPTHSDFYYQARPSIAIARPGDANGALALTSDWGLHPALQASIHPLYLQKQASFLAFAGTDDLTRSHFETQDSIELGQPLDGGRSFQSGFLNRLAQVLQKDSRAAVSTPMAFTAQLPLCLRGDAQVANMALASVGKGGSDEQRNQIIASMYQGTALDASVKEGFAVRNAVQRSVQEEMDKAGRNAIGTKGFSLVTQRMAALMRDHYDLGFVDVGGWDTHVNQGGANGYLAKRLTELGQGLATFADTMGPEAWRHTVVAVISEFGRTFRENGNKGTDHGHGTVYWLLGGGLAAQAGGKVLGEQVALSEKTLFQNRDYPVLNEYRAGLGGLFQRLYGLNLNQAQQVFPGTSPKDWRLI